MEDIKKFEQIFKGLANRRRLAILKVVNHEKELPVAEIARRIRLSFTSTSKHLIILKNLDILNRRQENLTVYYSVSKNLSEIVRKVILALSNSRE